MLTGLPAVEAKNVTKTFGAGPDAVVALDNVSVTIRQNEFFTLLGPSGCGKTTLLRMIAGSIDPSSGQILFGDHNTPLCDRPVGRAFEPAAPPAMRDITHLPPNRRNTGMVFQSYALWPHMTVAQNVAFGLDIRRIPHADRARRVADALDAVQMQDYADRKPNQLSGGQQQRIALARALVIRPDVLLLDEPLSNLDAKVRQRLRVEVRRLQRRIATTMIYVTHDQEEALAIADRVVLMHAGSVVQEGSPEEIYLEPASAFAADFLGVSNRLDGTAEAGVVRVGDQALAYAGPLRGPVLAIVRSSDLSLESAAEGDAVATLEGILEESLFLGAHYRHYVRVGETVLLADGPFALAPGRVKLRVPAGRLRVFRRPSPT